METIFGHTGISDSGVYCILNMVNGHFYVGSAIDFKDRLNCHKSHLKNKIHANKHLQRAWYKYGEENFQFIVIEETSSELAIVREQWFLDLCWDDGKYCYNIAKNAEAFNRGIKLSEEHKLKISKGLMGIKRPHSKIHTQNLSDAFIGRTPSEETRQKLRTARALQDSPHKNGNFHGGIKMWRVTFLNLQGQEVFVEENLAKFAKENNLNVAHLQSLTNGKRKYHKGWTLKV